MIKELLNQAFPESVVDTAETIDKALHLLSLAHQEQIPYDAVSLDFKLPRKELGEETVIDESVCEYIRLHFSGTLIAHISAFPDDPKIKQHIKLVHEGQKDRNDFYLSKLDPECGTQLVRRLKRDLYGNRIENELMEIFAPQPTSGSGKYLKRGGYGSGGLTRRHSLLLQDIVAHWRELDISVQNKIREIYQVDDSSEPIKIRLFRDEKDT
jgi:hypothetical protein